MDNVKSSFEYLLVCQTLVKSTQGIAIVINTIMIFFIIGFHLRSLFSEQRANGRFGMEG